MFATRLALLALVPLGLAAAAPDDITEAVRPDEVQLDSREGIQAIERSLDGSAEAETLLATLTRLSETAFVPEALFESLDRITRVDDQNIRVAAIRALGSIRSRDAAIRLFAMTTSDRPAADRDAAFAALRRLTGRSDLGDDRAAWSGLIDQVRSMPTSRWRRLLLQGLAEHADDLESASRSVENRLARTTRALYLATPESERPAMLAEMLTDPVPAVLTLGIDLASRAFSAGATLSDEAVAALVDLLDHESPQHRADAALLLSRVGDTDTGPAILNALTREQNDIAAQALLIAAARSPSQGLLDPTLRWLWSDRTRRAAAEAALSIARQSETTPAVRAQLRDALADVPIDVLPPAGMRARIMLGNDIDWSEVATQLTAAEPARRTAAADALGTSPGATRHLLSAAVDDPALFAPAYEALLRHHPTIEGFRMLLTLPSPTPNQASRDESLLNFSRRLSIEDLVIAAATETIPPETKAAMLSRLMTEPTTSDTARTHAAGLISLAETRLVIDDHTGALTAINRLRDVDAGLASGPRSSAASISALIALDRFEEADAIDAPALTWFEAALRVSDTEIRRRALDHIAAKIPTDDTPLARAYRMLVEALALQTRSSPSDGRPEATADDGAEPAAAQNQESAEGTGGSETNPG